MSNTIADAARLARFLNAADALARAMETGDCVDPTLRPALLTEYTEARTAFFGRKTSPARPPYTGKFR